MFDKITYMSNSECHLHIKSSVNVAMNLMNMHFVFEDGEKKILGEINDLDGDILKVKFLGEIQEDRFISGTIRKPNLNSQVRFISAEEIPLIMGKNEKGYLKLGNSPLYTDSSIYLPINAFFSNHFAIFGNTGSGKSCGVSRIFQNMFHDPNVKPYQANIFLFDSSGEYYNAFSNLSQIDPKFHYRFISTNEKDRLGEALRIPVYLLNRDDIALLLQCNSHTQLPIIERMLKLAAIFGKNDEVSVAYKNYLIAKAIMTLLYTNETAANKRNEIFSIIASCSTNEFNLEAPLRGIGYVRKFRECFLIDNSGNFTESVLLTEYVSSFIKEEFEKYEPSMENAFYNLDTLEKALNFTLISEGWLRNEQTYADAVTIRVRLHSLIVGNNAKYFNVTNYIPMENYIQSFTHANGARCQIININLNDIDDELAKTITKVFSRMIFDYTKDLEQRASVPFHIVLEEAHRYVQQDLDRFLFGYNIFERIAKEGRKYGTILGLISQRPGEISDTVISQCGNFLIFKLNHPTDLKYLREMVPHITDEIIEKQKALQPGTCLGFGLAFKIPLITQMEMPDPSPLSSNSDIVSLWDGEDATPAEKVIPNTVPTQPEEVQNNVVENIPGQVPNNIQQDIPKTIPEGIPEIVPNKIVPISNVVGDQQVVENEVPMTIVEPPGIDNGGPVVDVNADNFVPHTVSPSLDPDEPMRNEQDSAPPSAVDSLLGASYGLNPAISKLDS